MRVPSKKWIRTCGGGGRGRWSALSMIVASVFCGRGTCLAPQVSVVSHKDSNKEINQAQNWWVRWSSLYHCSICILLQGNMLCSTSYEDFIKEINQGNFLCFYSSCGKLWGFHQRNQLGPVSGGWRGEMALVCHCSICILLQVNLLCPTSSCGMVP